MAPHLDNLRWGKLTKRATSQNSPKPHEMHALEMHAHEIYAHEMHVYQSHAPEVFTHESHA
jgi:hypothetical protein